MVNPTPAAYAQLLIAQVAVGAAAIFARFALEGAEPVTVAGLRLGVAAILVTLMSLRRAPAPRQLRSELALMLAGWALALHFVTWIGSLRYISVAVSTLVVCTTPIWNALYEALVLRRPAPRAFFAALALAGVGLLLVVGDRAGSAPQPGHAAWGVTLAWLGSVAIGVYFVLVERVGQGTATHAGYSTWAIIVRTYGWAAVTLWVCGVVRGETLPAWSNQHAWLGIAGMAFISQALGHTLLNLSVRVFRPSIVAFATLLEPLCAAALAAVVFGERLTTQALLGGATVFVAVVMALRATARRRDTVPYLPSGYGGVQPTVCRSHTIP